MKKILLSFLLLLSSFAFGQNVELLSKLQNGDENTPTFFAEKIAPNYKLVKTKKFTNEDDVYFTYLPKDTSENDVSEYLINKNNREAITISYIASGKNYTFRNITGKCKVIFDFWKNEIQPNIIVKNNTDVSQDFYYSNSENKIKYYMQYTKLLDGSSCHFDNLNSNK